MSNNAIHVLLISFMVALFEHIPESYDLSLKNNFADSLPKIGISEKENATNNCHNVSFSVVNIDLKEGI